MGIPDYPVEEGSVLLLKTSVYHDEVQKAVERLRQDILRVSLDIHGLPELGLEEHHACALLTTEARAGGFEIQSPVAGMETAFVARYDSDKPGPALAFLCEYDALPGLGHACGHNIIAAASFGAAMALRTVVDELGGTLLLIGTPDEEAISDRSEGGKVVLTRAGVFDGLDAVFMMHPWGGDNQAWGYTFPLKDFTVSFEGKAAHYTQPENGINALEALIQFLNDVQAIKRGWSPSVMFAYTITDGGGPSAVVIPASAEAHITMKAFDLAYLQSRFEQVQACVSAVSAMTGAKGRIRILDEYRHMIPNLHLAASLGRNLKVLGGIVKNPVESQRELERRTFPGLSTDAADVSWVAPSIHGYCSIGGEDLAAHTPEFASAAGSAPGNEAAILSAKAMALTACDILGNPDFARRVKEEFRMYQDSGFAAVPGIPPSYLPFPPEFLETVSRNGDSSGSPG
jgi:amidohydrolase